MVTATGLGRAPSTASREVAGHAAGVVSGRCARTGLRGLGRLGQGRASYLGCRAKSSHCPSRLSVDAPDAASFLTLVQWGVYRDRSREIVKGDRYGDRGVS